MNNDAYANEDATQKLLRISKWPEPLRLAYLLEKEMLWPLHGRAADELRRLHAIETKLAEQPAQQEPFGYFKAEAFGWTDCDKTDEGAVALYEQPAQQMLKTAESVGYSIGFGEGYQAGKDAAHKIKEQK